MEFMGRKRGQNIVLQRQLHRRLNLGLQSVVLKVNLMGPITRKGVSSQKKESKGPQRQLSTELASNCRWYELLRCYSWLISCPIVFHVTHSIFLMDRH